MSTSTRNARNTVVPGIVIAGFTGDRSGSMCQMGDAPSTGLFEWINDQKQSALDNAQVGKLFVSTFDTVHDVRMDCVNIADTDITIDQCKKWMDPRGMTKLYDSAIADLDRLILAKEEYKKNMPNKLRQLDPKIVTVWACMTDGSDNKSDNTITDFKNKVKEAQDKHDITCFFLGANQDAVTTGVQYGFKPDNAITFGANEGCASSALRSASQTMRQVSTGSSNKGFTDNMRNLSTPHSTQTHRSIKQSPPCIMGIPNFPPPIQRANFNFPPPINTNIPRVGRGYMVAMTNHQGPFANSPPNGFSLLN